MSKRSTADYGRSEIFHPGQVWVSSSGCFWRVIAVRVGRHAVFRQGVDGAGRMAKRGWDDVIAWVLDTDAPEYEQDFEDLFQRISLQVDLKARWVVRRGSVMFRDRGFRSADQAKCWLERLHASGIVDWSPGSLFRRKADDVDMEIVARDGKPLRI